MEGTDANTNLSSDLLKNKEVCLAEFPKELSEYQKEWFCKFKSVFSQDTEVFVQMLKDAGCFDENNWKKNLKHVFYNFLHDESEEYKAAWNLIKQYHQTKKQKVAIFDFVIRRLPTNIETLTYITSLTLCDCEIKSLPTEVFRLTSLKSLTIKKCPMYEISEEIGQLSNLENLTLSRMRLTSLPQNIIKLAKLKRLDFSFNFISTFPSETSTTIAKKLISLDVQCNYINVLENCSFPVIKYLNISETPTSEIDVTQMPKLTTLVANDMSVPLNISLPQDGCHVLLSLQIRNSSISTQTAESILGMKFLKRFEFVGAKDMLGNDILHSLQQFPDWKKKKLYRFPKGKIDRGLFSEEYKRLTEKFLEQCK